MKIHFVIFLVVCNLAAAVYGQDCPKFCTADYSPVCAQSVTKGMGFKTFSNRCAMDNENTCNGGNYKWAYQGECRSSG